MSVIDDSGNQKHQTCGPGRARATRESLSRVNVHGENDNNREKNVNSLMTVNEKSARFTPLESFLNNFLTFVGQTGERNIINLADNADSGGVHSVRACDVHERSIRASRRLIDQGNNE